MLGMHGGYWTNMAMHRVDLLIAVGARFDDCDRETFRILSEARVIHMTLTRLRLKRLSTPIF